MQTGPSIKMCSGIHFHNLRTYVFHFYESVLVATSVHIDQNKNSIPEMDFSCQRTWGKMILLGKKSQGNRRYEDICILWRPF